MTQKTRMIIVMVAASLGAFQAMGQIIPLTPSSLEPMNTKVEEVRYKGKNVLKVTALPGGSAVAIVKGQEFKNGTIEVELSGAPGPNADSTNRGFIGVSFRIQKGDTLGYETIYLRPTNGRSTDQLRRNHAVQYSSHPNYSWFRLRKENPGLYESYADLVPGEWTKVKIVVKDKQAKLYVHDAAQPCLIVNDLKRGISAGSVGLWADVGVDGYFRNLKVTPAK
ncbi:MAG TPA: hypothetical protein VG737_13680 [Cyclobacteriaceae bacterium]|nr:hypothetical protein [Cyclobacteriaceae bacterium]